jgi:hypothetical protein
MATCEVVYNGMLSSNKRLQEKEFGMKGFVRSGWGRPAKKGLAETEFAAIQRTQCRTVPTLKI